MQDKVLVIDDDTTLLKLIRQALESAQFQVSTATSGLEGLQKMYAEQPQLVILDVMMPRMDGWQVCTRIRELSQTPIIMLTAKDEEADRLKGFELEVDDYVTKPFSFAELTARVKAVLRRSQGSFSGLKSRIYVAGDIVVDIGRHHVTRGGETINLTPTEFRLLVALIENRGRVLTQEQLLHRVWGSEYGDETGYVKRYIWYLRQKLEEEPSSPKYILTERGFGYFFRQD